MYSKIIEEDCLEILQDVRLLNMIKGKSFLITGSNGLIGNYFTHLLHVANEYFNADTMAYCISKHKPSWRNGKFYHATFDLSSREAFPECFSMDYIIHGATYPRPRLFSTIPNTPIHSSLFPASPTPVVNVDLPVSLELPRRC